MVKRGFIVLFLFFFQSLTFAQNNQRGATVSVNISTDDTSAVPNSLHVMILASAGGPVADTFTSYQMNTDFNGIGIGNYKVRVSGPEIEEATVPFTVLPRQNFLLVSVRITRKPVAQPSTSSSVSAADLNIPEKARKEFEKGMDFIEKKNDLPDADSHFAKALNIYPHYASALNARGVVAMHMQKPIEAEDFFRKSITTDGQFSPAYVNLAKLLVAEKKEAESEDLLNKSLSQNPRDPNALSVLANLYLTTGRLDDAVATARKIHSVPHADYSVGHLIAAMALERKNLDEQAAVEYRQFLEEAPNSISAEKVKAQLAAIEKRVH